jgi:transcriptional regulator with XRE-family HTH domain
MTDEEFATHIQLAMKRWSLSELADMMYVSQPTVIRWSRGENLPYLAIRSAILKYLSCPSQPDQVQYPQGEPLA